MIYLFWSIVCIWGSLIDIITDRGNRPDWIVKWKDLIWLCGYATLAATLALLGTCGYGKIEFILRSIPVGFGCSIFWDAPYGYIKSKDIFAPAPFWLNLPFLRIDISSRTKMKKLHILRIIILATMLFIK